MHSYTNGVAFKCICLGYTYVNAFTLIDIMVTLFLETNTLRYLILIDLINTVLTIIIHRIMHAFD